MDKEAPPLIEAVDEFIERHSMSPVTFGRCALRDPHFVRDLRGGRRLWPETEKRVRDFMIDHEGVTSSQRVAA